MKKRILPLLLAFLLLLCACASEEPKDEDVFENVGPVSPGPDKVDTNADYGGYKFTILTSYREDNEIDSLFAADRNGEKINEKILERNSAIEKKYTLTLTEYASSTPSAELDADRLSETDGYDMVFVSAPDAAMMISAKSLVDLADFAAFDLEKNYFDQNAIDGLSIANKTYALVGTLTPETVSATSAVICNNSILGKIDFEGEFGKKLIDTVNDGEWTLDVMMQAIKIANALGSENEENDLFYGFRAEKGRTYDLVLGADSPIFRKEASGFPTVNVGTDRFKTLLEKLSGLRFESVNIASGEVLGTCYNMDIKTTESLFSLSTLANVKALSGSTFCFSVLPMPKYDASQASYACRVDTDKINMAAIPSSTPNLSRSAAILSSLFDESNALCSEYLSSFYTRCQHSDSDATDTVIASTKYDIADLFGWGDFEAALADVVRAPDLSSAIAETLGARGTVAEKAMDILLKRLVGENYKEISENK